MLLLRQVFIDAFLRYFVGCVTCEAVLMVGHKFCYRTLAFFLLLFFVKITHIVFRYLPVYLAFLKPSFCCLVAKC